MKNLFTKLLILSFLGVLHYQSGAQIACNSLIQVGLFQEEVEVLPEFILEGTLSGDYELSKDGVNFASSITYDCSEVGINVATVRSVSTGETCWGEVLIEDIKKPSPFFVSLASFPTDPVTCSVELYAEYFNSGTYDNCGVASYSFGQNPYLPLDTIINDTLIDLSVAHYFNEQGMIVGDSAPPQAILDSYASGELLRWDPIRKSAIKVFFPKDYHSLELVVTDVNGLYTPLTCWVLIEPCDGTTFPACLNNRTIATNTWNPITTIPASNFVEGSAENVEVSLDSINYVSELELNCGDVGEGLPLFVRYDYNGATEDCKVLFNFRDLTPPVAIAEPQVLIRLADASDVVTISVDDIDDGSYDICGIANRTLSKSSFDINDLGPNQVILTVEDESGNTNTVISEVFVNLEGDCNFTANDILWPDAVLEINVPNIDPSSLSPEALVMTYGFTTAQVEPSLSISCNTLPVSYQDVVIDLALGADNYFKIVRTWTLLNWYTADVYTFTQLINNQPNSSLFICDFLPRIAPVGDCNSGHTLDDDVEWPNDILVDDHRIDPIELVAISGIDPLDAAPSYYNEPNQYSHTYEDVLIDLNPTEIELNRRWTVTRLDNGFTYFYNQLIAVDISNFGNLVTVSDPLGRASEGVEINGSIETDDRGRAIIVDDVDSVEKKDASFRGLTLRDLELMREHILGIRYLDTIGAIAGDLNESGSLTTLDIVLLTKYLIGESDISEYEDLRFIEVSDDQNEALEPKAAYIAYRPGDVDHSYVVGDSINGLMNAVAFKDQILNAGERYSTPLYLTADVSLEALQLIDVAYDNQKVIVEKSNNSLPGSLNNLNIKDNTFNALLSFANANGDILLGDAVLYVDFVALENGLLSDVIDLNSTTVTVLANGRQLYQSDVEVSDVISTPTIDVDGHTYKVKVYPNPSSSIVHFELNNNAPFQTIRLFNSFGQLVLSKENKNWIHVDELPNGLYIYQLELRGQVINGRLQVMKP